MSNVLTSSFTVDTPQIDGRVWVHETFTDVAGGVHSQDWLADPDMDVDAALAVHASVVSDSLRDGEIAANIHAIRTKGHLAVPTHVFSVVPDNVAAFRAALPTMSVASMLMAADFLIAQSDALLEGAYAIDAAQVTALRALPSLTQQGATVAAIIAEVP